MNSRLCVRLGSNLMNAFGVGGRECEFGLCGFCSDWRMPMVAPFEAVSRSMGLDYLSNMFGGYQKMGPVFKSSRRLSLGNDQPAQFNIVLNVGLQTIFTNRDGRLIGTS